MQNRGKLIKMKVQWSCSDNMIQNEDKSLQNGVKNKKNLKFR